MSIFVIVILSVFAAIILYLIFAYNRLVRFKNLTQEGWSGIDIQLKQRANLIPSNLIATQFHFLPVDYFEIEDAKEREVPAVKFS